MRKYLKLFLIGIIVVNFACLSFCPQASADSKQEAEQYRDAGFKAQIQGNPEKAYENYKKAAELNPTWPVIYNDLGVILEEKGRFNEAESMYFKAMSLDDKYPSSYTNLAILSERRQDFPNAIFYWKKRIELGSDNDIWVERAKERIRILGYYEPQDLKDRLTPPGANDVTNANKGLSADENRKKVSTKKIETENSKWMDKVSVKGPKADIIEDKRKTAVLLREQGFNNLSEEVNNEINEIEAPELNVIREDKSTLRTEHEKQWKALNLDEQYCLDALAKISKNDTRAKVRETALKVLWLHDEGYDISAKSEWQKILDAEGLPPDDSE